MALDSNYVEILEAVTELGDCSIKSVKECVTYTDEHAVVKEDMHALWELNLLKRQGNGMWIITNTGKEALGKVSSGVRADNVASISLVGKADPKPKKQETKPKPEKKPKTEDSKPNTSPADDDEIKRFKKQLEDGIQLAKEAEQKAQEIVSEYQRKIEQLQQPEANGDLSIARKLNQVSSFRDELDQHTKIKVLDSLSVLVVDDISEVLISIKHDLLSK